DEVETGGPPMCFLPALEFGSKILAERGFEKFAIRGDTDGDKPGKRYGKKKRNAPAPMQIFEPAPLWIAPKYRRGGYHRQAGGDGPFDENPRTKPEPEQRCEPARGPSLRRHIKPEQRALRQRNARDQRRIGLRDPRFHRKRQAGRE